MPFIGSIRADEENLLADKSAGHDGKRVASYAQVPLPQRRKQLCASYCITLTVLTVLAVSLLLVIHYAGQSSLFTGKNNPSSPPPSLHYVVQQFEEIEAAEWSGVLDEVHEMVESAKWIANTNHAVAEAINKSNDTDSCSIPENDRFDCWPEYWSAEQQTCEKRGCCWSPSPDDGVPFCFYPDNYVGYAATSSTASDTGLTTRLTRKSASPYPPDVMELQADVVYQTESTVRFRVRYVYISLVKKSFFVGRKIM